MNLENDYIPWLVGSIYEDSASIKGALPSSLAPRRKLEGHRTTINDEFSNWPHSHNLADQQNMVVQCCTQDIRKAHQRHILVVHGEAKDMICPHAQSGRFDSLMYQAAVVKLGSKTNDWGEFESAGWMHFKPPGKPYTTGNIKKNIALPKCFLPPNDDRPSLKEELGELIDRWEMTLSTAEERGALISPEIEEYTSQINGSDERIKNMLKKAITDNSAKHPDEAEMTRSAGDWTTIPQAELILQLLKYCFSKQHALMEENGGIAVRKLQQNWARHQPDLDAQGLKDLLEITVSFNIGTYVDDEKKYWRPTISSDSLPEDDS